MADRPRPWRGPGGWAAAFGALLPALLPREAAAGYNVSYPPDNFLELSSKRNNTDVCLKMKFESLETCREYSIIGLDADKCESWGQMAELACLKSNGNCTYIADDLTLLCRLQLQDFVRNPEYRISYCLESMNELREYRCPPTSYAPLNESLCYVQDELNQYTRHYSKEAMACMTTCATYNKCYCRHVKGTLLKDTCTGEPIKQGPLPGTWDQFGKKYVSPGNFSCNTLGQPPTKCRHHIKEGMECAQYKYCPVDMCIINDVECPNRTQCEEVGDCDPKDGWCHYKYKPNGLPCDDGVYYTFGDKCHDGICDGIVDYCIKYNVSCVPQSVCLLGGTCNSVSGRCVYKKVPDGTKCDDHREYTVEDRCSKGLCLGKVVNLCVERGVICETPNECYDVGVCDPLTGMCSDPIPAEDNRRCDDKDPSTINETCIDGLCLGEPANATYEFLTFAGFGECSDRDGRRMGRYSGDVLEGEDACLQYCLEDVQCSAYGYAFPLCSIYGTARTRAPTSSRRPWSFELGTDPPAVAVEMVKPTVPGQRATVCRKKGFVSDTLETSAQFKVDREEYFNFMTVFYLSMGMMILFFCWPLVLCNLSLCCPKRFAVAEDIVEAVEKPKPKKDRRRRRKKRRQEEDEDDDSDEDGPGDLRAVADNQSQAPPALGNDASAEKQVLERALRDAGIVAPTSRPEESPPPPAG